MCGIFSLLNNDGNYSDEFVANSFSRGRGRGPEYSKLERIGLKHIMGFHRLAINGLNKESNQPLVIGNVTLVCNGEIYNYKELYEMMGITPKSESDCEVIIHLYKKYGIDHTLQMLDGVFAFVLCDYDINSDCAKTYVARDPYGVRPLYMLYYNSDITEKYAKLKNNLLNSMMKKETTDSSNNTINIEIGSDIYNVRHKTLAFASELKMLYGFKEENFVITHFEPGTYSLFVLPHTVSANWSFYKKERFHTTGFNSVMYTSVDIKNKQQMANIYKNIQFHFCNAVKKRCVTTDRPIACLLSGGLDSSLVTALVNEYHTELYENQLETYSIGLEGSEDLRNAKIVADYLKTKHTEIIVTEQDLTNVINDVVYSIESYDTTTIRASLGNYLLGRYISKNSGAKVIFNGDGSDELCGGYLYMHECPDEVEFDKETRRLLKYIYAFDVLRSDKCISTHGLEPRTPFLDRSWVQYYLSIHPSLRFHPKHKKCEKYLLRTAFSKEHFKNSEGKPLLPDEIIWRTKEAFSDGVSKTTRSLYEIIQDYIYNGISEEDRKQISDKVTKTEIERKYYKLLFQTFYKDVNNIIPHYWMPKYVEATDASARTLSIYSKIHNTSSSTQNTDKKKEIVKKKKVLKTTKPIQIDSDTDSDTELHIA